MSIGTRIKPQPPPARTGGDAGDLAFQFEAPGLIVFRTLETGDFGDFSPSPPPFRMRRGRCIKSAGQCCSRELSGKLGDQPASACESVEFRTGVGSSSLSNREEGGM